MAGLDKNITNLGYCIGRVFGVVEEIMLEANTNLYPLDREAAHVGTNTRTAVGRALKLAQKGLAILRRTDFDRAEELRDILDDAVWMLPATLPGTLSAHDDSMFALGEGQQGAYIRQQATA